MVGVIINFIDFIICIIQSYFLLTLILAIIMMDLYAMALNSAPNFSGGYNWDQSNDPVYDFPLTEEPVWLLAHKYSTLHELEELRNDFRSRIWLTYRKNFAAIGGTGPASDTGWGCMLRCGQMVLAEALIRRHLSREWRWNSDAPLQCDLQYREILKLFQDKKNSTYSIHQIAMMGASPKFNISVGSWFGPNTVAQVLKKLSAYDHYSKIVIHVSLNNIVVIDDIKNSCTESTKSLNGETSETAESTNNWKPLLLFIPLRLGLSEINPIYFKALQKTFTFKQSLGIIGGRPNHALYFIGVIGNELIYLDPHTTQSTVDIDDPASDDSSYHCERALRMDISYLDPSISLCFYCHTEADFDNWCKVIVNVLLINSEKQPLFELVKERPKHWPQIDEDEEQITVSTPNSMGPDAFILLEETHHTTSDEEFELLG